MPSKFERILTTLCLCFGVDSQDRQHNLCRSFMKPHMNRDVFHTKDVFFKRAAKICAAVRFCPGPCPKRFKSGDTHLEVHASNVWNISIIQHQSNFKGKVAFVK